MRDRTKRQLAALCSGALMLAGGSLAPAQTPSPAAQELLAAKVLETSLRARGGSDTETAKMRRVYAELELKYPNDPAIKNAYAEFLWSLEERAAAVRQWEAALRLTPTNAVVLNHLGGAHLAGGDVRAAYDCFTRATEAQPSAALYHFNLANVAFLFRHELPPSEARAFEVATEHFAAASRLEPGSADYLRAYAELFYSLPKPDWRAALAAWQRFHELTPHKDFALANLARVHMKLGQKVEARACLAQIHGPAFDRLKARLNDRIDSEP